MKILIRIVSELSPAGATAAADPPAAAAPAAPEQQIHIPAAAALARAAEALDDEPPLLTLMRRDAQSLMKEKPEPFESYKKRQVSSCGNFLSALATI